MDISTVFPVLVSLIVVGALAGFLAGPPKRLFGDFLLLVVANMVRSALWP